MANVQAMFAASGVECVLRPERGRLFVHAEDEAAAARLLRRVFGITSLSPAKEVSSERVRLTAFVAEYAKAFLTQGMTFAIRSRRTGEHPYTSQELARVLGQAVRDAVPGVVVDLEAPDRTIRVEVRGPRAYVFHEVINGPGGLPIGSQGDVFAAADDEAGMVATWLVMRRGCRARVAGQEPFVSALRRWDPRLEVVPTQTDELPQLAGGKGVPLVWSSRPGPRTEGRAPFLLDPLTGLSEGEVRDLARRVRET